jgi:4-hydroxybutyrate CoA-transferase
MEAWRSLYAEKRTDACRALLAVQSGNTVVLGHAAGEPRILVQELLRQAARLKDVTIVHMVPLYGCEYTKPEYRGIFRHNALFAGAGTRDAIACGDADYTPCFLSEIPRLFRDRHIPVDVALIQVSPPDEHGWMSFGVSVDYTMQAAASAAVTIAEVNARTPRTHGSWIHVSEVDFIVEADYPLAEIPRAKLSDVEKKIGENVATLVDDRATLQLGIGALPDAVINYLSDKKDLGIHTEMFSDSVVELVERGVITNRYNNVSPGKTTASFLMGSQKLYGFVHDNPAVDMRPIDYTNSILVAGRVQNLVSINSALEVDLYGQVCADMIGPKQFSGVGGQVDFVRAASAAPGGKSILAFSSTARGGASSRIVHRLTPGACVTTSRNEVHYIVTEYGIAELRGKTNRQRAEALMRIAHPDFRAALLKQACV